MADNELFQEIGGIRSMLANPLVQSPPIKDIIEEMEATYQDATNLGNNTGKAWQVNSFTLTTVAGTRTYVLDPSIVGDFYKALTVVTTPQDDANPQYPLEFTEIKHLPQEWGWLGQNQGMLFDSSHSSSLIAFYRTFADDGEEIVCEIRPTPNSVQQYTVWYQVGDWWDDVMSDPSSFVNRLPNKEFRFYFRALAALNLLPKTRWSFGDDSLKKAEVKEMLERRIAKGEKAFIDHLASVDNEDIVMLETWADTVDPYWNGVRYK